MPSPAGQIYTRALAESPDPIVSKALRGLPWDEVLSGAASGVALGILEGEKPTPYRLRWHAVLAAWPYPLVGFASARVEHGAVASEIVEEARKRAAAGQELGVVRARQADGDWWVLLASTKPEELGPLPRDPESGATLHLLGPHFLMVDPRGRSYEQGAGDFKVQQEGVWIVRAQDNSDQTIATFPLFVGIQAPLVPPVAEEVEGLNEAAGRQVMNEVRAWYQLPDFQEDDALDSVARARLNALLSKEALPEPTRSLRAAGFVDVPVAGAECRAPTVASCVDGLWWTPERRAIFTPDLRSLGIAVHTDAQGVTMVLVAAG